MAELRRRCDLTAVSPVSRDYHTTVWQRSGLGPDIVPVDWWLR